MGYYTYTLLLIALVIGFATQNLNTTIPAFDINSFKQNLTWAPLNLSVEQSPDLSDALNYAVNGIGNAAFSFARWVSQWAYENPTVPFKLLVICCVIAILAPVIVMVFKLIVIIFILIKEHFDKRKERKNISNY